MSTVESILVENRTGEWDALDSLHWTLDWIKPGRPTVQDAALIRRKRRFDSFSGDSKESQTGDVKWPHRSDGNKNTRHAGGRGVTAAQQAFNLHGGGSNPSGLTSPWTVSACGSSGPRGLEARSGSTTSWQMPGPVAQW